MPEDRAIPTAGVISARIDRLPATRTIYDRRLRAADDQPRARDDRALESGARKRSPD